MSDFNTWVPTARIVKAPAPGVSLPANADMPLWPASWEGAGNDYSVDFTAVLTVGETIETAVFQSDDDMTVAWTAIFGPVATMWTTWTRPGNITVLVGIRTNYGATYQTRVGITLDSQASVVPPQPPATPGNVVNPLLPAFKSLFQQMFNALPTAEPTDEKGLWNNGGMSISFSKADPENDS